MIRLLAIDPGTTESGWVLLENGRVKASGIDDNEDVLHNLRTYEWQPDRIAIEMIASYGMAVGKDVFETCVWIGRFWQASAPTPIQLVYRKDVKMHLCGTPRAKDPNVRQALIDKIGQPGTKKNPGPTYGVSGHMWAALAVGITALEAA